MVKAELTHNPYLNETSIRFNGQQPHINSLVEKYQNEHLHDWINKIPQIFHDEMNGYDFELDFSGTVLDCEEIRTAFSEAGVSEDDVYIFFKNELEPRETKVVDIENLLNWLEENPNRKFDYTSFRQKYNDIFDEDYSLITLHGEAANINIPGVSIDNIENVYELESTDIEHTPILIFVSAESSQVLPKELQYLLEREDIDEKQLFFCVDINLRRNKVKRFIKDLGIRKPNIVDNVDDYIIKKYFLIYPITDYIIAAISAFRSETENISVILDEENKQSLLDSKEIHEQIEILEEKIKKLKNADEMIMSRDNLEIPPVLKDYSNEFKENISEWRSKKSKITKSQEAYTAAEQFNADLHRYYKEYYNDFNEALKKSAEEIQAMFIEWYRSAEFDEAFSDDIEFFYESEFSDIPDQTLELMKYKEEKFVVPKSSFIESIFKTASGNDSKNLELETTFHLSNWREHMIKIIVPIIEKNNEEAFELLKQYYDNLAEVYHTHLSELIASQTNEKDDVASQLSEDEKLLQKDNDWLTSFIDQLKNIERS